MIDETTAGQTRQALMNLKAVLEESGATLDNVVKTLVLLHDMEDFQTVNAIYSEFFNGEVKPARSCFAVKDLPSYVSPLSPLCNTQTTDPCTNTIPLW